MDLQCFCYLYSIFKETDESVTTSFEIIYFPRLKPWADPLTNGLKNPGEPGSFKK